VWLSLFLQNGLHEIGSATSKKFICTCEIHDIIWIQDTKSMPKIDGGLFNSDEYRARFNRTRKLLEDQKWDALLCYASGIIPGNVRYLSGYETRLRIHDASYLLFVPGADAEIVLFTNAFWEHPEELTWIKDIVLTGMFGEEIVARIPKSVKRLAVAGFRFLPLATYLELRGQRPAMEILDGSLAFLETRMVKSPAEIQALRRCQELCDIGANKFLELVQLGARERDIAAGVEYAMKTSGSDELSYTTQVGRGTRTDRVVVYPRDERLEAGDPVQLDCGSTWEGYRGDLSRVAVVGRPNPDYRRLLNAVEEMYLRCLETSRPGIEASKVAQVGIEVARAHGLEEYIYRSVNHASRFMGHGIGCHFSEPPELYPESHTVLLENMVLVIEPILTVPELGGVKIEDLVLITSTGAQRLSSSPIHSWTD
jgi:Xaa-Pro aminopeptidase